MRANRFRAGVRGEGYGVTAEHYTRTVGLDMEARQISNRSLELKRDRALFWEKFKAKLKKEERLKS